MVIRIAYFSWKGHTQKVATALAQRVNADLVRIEPLKEFNIALGGMKAFLAKQAPIKPCKTDLAGIDTLVIATPVWSGKVPPYINEYLSAITCGEGKPFHVLAEMGGRGSEGAIAAVKNSWKRRVCVLSLRWQRLNGRLTAGHSPRQLTHLLPGF